MFQMALFSVKDLEQPVRAPCPVVLLRPTRLRLMKTPDTATEHQESAEVVRLPKKSRRSRRLDDLFTPGDPNEVEALLVKGSQRDRRAAPLVLLVMCPPQVEFVPKSRLLRTHVAANMPQRAPLLDKPAAAGNSDKP